MEYSDLSRPPLDGAALHRALVGPGTWWRDVVTTDATPSTNADLATLARSGAPEGTLVTTDHQVAGRGRLDRTWTTPPRAATAVSVLVRPDPVPLERWSWLPLLTGIAVAESVREATGVEAELKWPNDVMVADRKLAGILLERVVTDVGDAAVVGVGTNVHQGADELPVHTATSLAVEGMSGLDRTLLVRAYARTFEALYRAWAAAEGDPASGLHASYVRRCSTLGRRVRIDRPGDDPLTGTAEAIDAAGRLVVRSGGRQHAFSAGDVVHVRPGA